MRIGKILTRMVFPGMLAAGGLAGSAWLGHRVIQNHAEQRADRLQGMTTPQPGINPLSWYLDRSYYFMSKELDKLVNLRQTLWTNFTTIGNIQVLQLGDSHYNNTYRLKLANTDLVLYVMTTQDH